MFTSEDYERVIDQIPAIVVEQLKNNDVVLAGGFIRDTLLGLPVSDLDIFCKSKELAKSLSEVDGELGILETSCSFTRIVDGLKIQYIYSRPFEAALPLIEDFDFTCCGVALVWYFSSWIWYKVDGFESDASDMKLVFRCAEFNKGNLNALGRAFKFVQKGWYLPEAEQVKLIHHYVAYAPAIQSLGTTPRRREIRTGLRNVVAYAYDHDGTFTQPDDNPAITLETVARAVRPRGYNRRASNA